MSVQYTLMSGYHSLRWRTYEVLEKARTEDRFSWIVDATIVVLVVANIAAVILESFDGFYSRYTQWFFVLEIVSVIIFSTELVLRLWTSDFLQPKGPRIVAMARFLVSPIGLIDIMAILPFYLPLLIPVDVQLVRILRLARLLRLLKLARYTSSVATAVSVIRKRSHELIVTVFLTSLLLIVASTLMYYLESKVQPEAFPNIIASVWWAVATLTTIGYGDVVPVTGLGRLLSGIIAVLGIGLVALPTAIISSGFIEGVTKKNELDKKEEQPSEIATFSFCPHCGKPLNQAAELERKRT